jgi:hypothetical protein
MINNFYSIYLFTQIELIFNVCILLRKYNTYVPKLKLNSVAFSPQANYTDRAIAACRRS